MSKDGYKKTELGYLPFDWDVKRIEAICEILDSKRVPLNKEQRDNMKGNIPYYGANGVVDYINEYLFDEDLILMAEDGGYFDEYRTRHIAYKVKGKSWVNNHAHVLKVLDSKTYEFIYYTLVHKNILPFINGGTRAKLNQADLKKIQIQYPPLKEQQKIAEILSSVDAAIEKTEQVIAKTEEVKKGLMQQLLTKGISHTEFKQTEVGKIPIDWKIEILGEISSITRLAGAEYTDYWNPIEDGNIIALRGYNIGRNKLILDNVEKISEDLSNKLYRSKLFIDDIVFPCVGTIGKAAVIYEDNKFHINQNIAKITPNSNIKSEYLAHYLMSDNIRSEILKYNTSTSQPNVLVGNLRKFKIIVPSVNEQQIISGILNNYDKKLDIEFNRLEILKDIKKGLMQQLLTGEVRVGSLC